MRGCCTVTKEDGGRTVQNVRCDEGGKDVRTSYSSEYDAQNGSYNAMLIVQYNGVSCIVYKEWSYGWCRKVIQYARTGRMLL